MMRSRFPALPVLAASCALLIAPRLHADVRLPSLISDNMVLLQDSPANVWGWADPQENVTVKLRDKSVQATAGTDGKWSVKLEGLQAGDAGEMTISGKNSITVKNVAVGEVWVCSGQSNMEWIVSNSKDAQKEISEANHPLIRMFTVQKAAKAEPQDNCIGKWEVCATETVGHFSAVGYFFGRHLADNLKIPIGLIHSSWGGTPAEHWTPTDVLAADEAYQPAFKRWQQLKESYPKARADYDKAMTDWKEAMEKAKAAGAELPKQPRAPQGGDDFGSPGCLYNGMIHPLLPYTIRGATWYQGESNAGNAKQYRVLFPTMIRAWRDRWGVGEFPFLYVQLANFMERHPEPTNSNWAALREAQLMTLQLPHTGMAVIIDIGEAKDIHPKNKQDVGRRLGLVAQATVYYQDVEFSGPLFSAAQEEDGKVRLTFRHAEGLKASDGGPLKGFAIAGEDRKFVWANAEIQGDHVIVSSPQVPQPASVRYAWADNPECNLVNEANLPASPFRTDDWPQQ